MVYSLNNARTTNVLPEIDGKKNEHSGSPKNICDTSENFRKEFYKLYGDVSTRDRNDKVYILKNYDYLIKRLKIKSCDMLDILTQKNDDIDTEIIKSTEWEIFRIEDGRFQHFHKEIITESILREVNKVNKYTEIYLIHKTVPYKYQLQAIQRFIDIETSSPVPSYVENQGDLVTGVNYKSSFIINAMKPGAGKTLSYYILFIETKNYDLEYKNQFSTSSMTCYTNEIVLPCNVVVANSNLLKSAWYANYKRHINQENCPIKLVYIKDEDFPVNCYGLAKDGKYNEYNIQLNKFYNLCKDADVVLIEPDAFHKTFYLMREFKMRRLIVDEPHLIDCGKSGYHHNTFTICNNDYAQVFSSVHINCATPHNIYTIQTTAFGDYLVKGSVYLLNLPLFASVLRNNTIIYSDSYIESIKKTPKDIVVIYKHKALKLSRALEILDNEELNSAVREQDFNKLTKLLGIATIGLPSIKSIYDNEIEKAKYKIEVVEKEIEKLEKDIKEETEFGFMTTDTRMLNNGNHLLGSEKKNGTTVYYVIRQTVINRLNESLKDANNKLKSEIKSYEDIKERFETEYSALTGENTEDNCCSICYEDIKDYSIVSHPCNHRFCTCVATWFIKDKSTCPYCNTECTVSFIDPSKDESVIEKIYASKLDILIEISRQTFKKILLCIANLSDDNTEVIEKIYKDQGYEIYNFSNKRDVKDENRRDVKNIDKAKLHSAFVGTNNKAVCIIDSKHDSAGLDFITVDCKIYHGTINDGDREQIDGRTNRPGRKFPCTNIVIESE